MPSTSKSQQRLFGMVHACQKYGKCGSGEIQKVAKNIDPKDAEDFAKTKHKGLPERKKKKKKKKKFSEWLKNMHPEYFEATNYEFGPGDRVRHRNNFQMAGEVTNCVPGNGSFPWYYVKWDNGQEDRHTSDELEKE
jgi:hypothetical protein